MLGTIIESALQNEVTAVAFGIGAGIAAMVAYNKGFKSPDTSRSREEVTDKVVLQQLLNIKQEIKGVKARMAIFETSTANKLANMDRGLVGQMHKVESEIRIIKDRMDRN